MTFLEALPSINAGFNATAATLMASGWVAIKFRREILHRNLMVCAFASSSLFLAGYLTRMTLAGSRHFPGEGAWRTVYLTILFSHMILAMAVVPLVIVAIWLGWTKRRQTHKKVTRFALPIWAYVSVTGVVVYLMLYHWPVSSS